MQFGTTCVRWHFAQDARVQGILGTFGTEERTRKKFADVLF